MQRPFELKDLPNSDQPSHCRPNDNRDRQPRTGQTGLHVLPKIGGVRERQPQSATGVYTPVVSHPPADPPFARSTPFVRRTAAVSRPVARPSAPMSPSAFRFPAMSLHPDLPSPGGHIQETVRGGNTTDGASVSVLSSAKGSIDITGGTFNAVGGNLLTVQVILNGMREGVRLDSVISEPVSKKTTEALIQDNGHVEAARSEPLTSNCPSHNSLAQLAASTIPIQSISDVYYRCLASKKRGSPLWIPGTNKRLPTKYRRNGLMVGDAGLITDRGCYDSLFNITLPPNDPLAINTDRLPENFSPLHITPSDIQEYSEFNRGSYLSSASIKNSYQDEDPFGLIFESSASEGAILTLPDGSNSEDLGNKKKLLDYLSAHGEEMYRCTLIDHGRIIKNGDLRVVTGYDKTTNWGMAAFSNSTAEADSFRLKFRPSQQGSLGRTHSWESSGSAEVKAGPDVRETIALRMGDPSQQDMEYENQSVFVRTENITLAKDIWNKLMSQSGAGNIELDGDSDTSSSHLSASAEGSHLSRASAISCPPTSSSENYPAPSDWRSAHSFSFPNTSPNTLAMHPSNGINEILLMVQLYLIGSLERVFSVKLNPSARIAITADEVWISVLTEADLILPSVEHLWERIMESFVTQEEDGVVFLKKITTPLTSLSPHISTIPLYFDSESTNLKDTRHLNAASTEPLALIRIPHSLILDASPPADSNGLAGTDDCGQMMEDVSSDNHLDEQESSIVRQEVKALMEDRPVARKSSALSMSPTSFDLGIMTKQLSQERNVATAKRSLSVVESSRNPGNWSAKGKRPFKHIPKERKNHRKLDHIPKPYFNNTIGRFEVPKNSAPGAHPSPSVNNQGRLPDSGTHTVEVHPDDDIEAPYDDMDILSVPARLARANSFNPNASSECFTIYSSTSSNRSYSPPPYPSTPHNLAMPRETKDPTLNYTENPIFGNIQAVPQPYYSSQYPNGMLMPNSGKNTNAGLIDSPDTFFPPMSVMQQSYRPAYPGSWPAESFYPQAPQSSEGNGPAT